MREILAAVRRLAVFLLLAGAELYAEQLPIRIYTTSEGLGYNQIYCIVQDPHGFLWFCTYQGLSRFDGYTFTNYGTEHGLPGSMVKSLAITRDGRYWVGTSKGLYRFDPNSLPPQRFELVPTDANDHHPYVTALLVDRSDVLWVGTGIGLYQLAGTDKRTCRPVPLPRNDAAVYSLMEDGQGSLWIGSGEIYRRTPDAGFTTYHDRRFGGSITALYADRAGRFWASTPTGVFRLNANAGPKDPIIARVYTSNDGRPSDQVGPLLETVDGQFWAATGNRLGVYMAAQDRFKSYTTAQGLSDGEISALSEDSEGNLWVGTSTNGVMKIAYHGFTSYTETDGLDDARVSSIFVAQTGELCVGSQLKRAWSDSPRDAWSLACFNGKRFASVRPQYRRVIRNFGSGLNQAAFQDHAGDWWIPTGEGLYRFGKVSRFEQLAKEAPKAIFTKRDGLPGNNILRLFEDSRGDIWISTRDRLAGPGLARWERSTGLIKVYSAVHDRYGTFSRVTAFAEDRSGQIWMGLYLGGLARFDKEHFTFYSTDDGLGEGTIKALYVDHAGRLWIATSHGGLGRIDHPNETRPRIVRYTIADGLSNDIGCITEDQWGRIYACTAQGVDRLNPSSNSIRHYTTADGLVRGAPHAARRDREGALWFASGFGLSRLVPEPDVQATPPPVFIMGLQVRGLSQPLAELGQVSISGLVLRPNENQVRFDFVGLSFAPGEALRYQYRLEGADGDWSPPTEQRTMNYASLKPGHYIFQVRALNAEGVMTPRPAAVSFTILAPLWQRGWFLTAAVLTLIAMVYGAYRYRLAQLLEIERIRTHIASDLHDDIGSNLTRIAILSEVAHRRLGEIDPKGAAPLSSIAQISRESTAAMSDIVWAINPRRDTLHDLVSRMRRFAEEILAAAKIGFLFHAPESGDEIPLGADVRRGLFLIFKEFVNNTVRHSGCSNVEINLRVERLAIVLRVKDNGKGFVNVASSEGQGLTSMARRAKSLGAELQLTSLPGQGTEITVRVPNRRP